MNARRFVKAAYASSMRLMGAYNERLENELQKGYRRKGSKVRQQN